MAFNLDTNKSVIILSHPRSGSTWIQDSLPHFNLIELFTMYCGIKQVDMDTGIKYNYSNTANNDLEYRFELFDKFAERHKAVSVKTHLHLLTEPLCKFFEQRDLQYVLLERKNKRDTFWSLLIALNTLEFHNTINKKNIVIPVHSINDALQIIKEYYNKRDIIRARFNPIEIYYEDMLTLPESDCWKPSNKYVIQNAKEVIVIENINEVKEYLNKISAPWECI
jgi:hypothetical protein